MIRLILLLKLDHELHSEIVGCLPHDRGVTVLKYMLAADCDVAVSRPHTHRRLGTEVYQLAAEIPLVLRHICFQGQR